MWVRYKKKRTGTCERTYLKVLDVFLKCLRSYSGPAPNWRKCHADRNRNIKGAHKDWAFELIYQRAQYGPPFLCAFTWSEVFEKRGPEKARIFFCLASGRPTCLMKFRHLVLSVLRLYFARDYSMSWKKGGHQIRRTYCQESITVCDHLSYIEALEAWFSWVWAAKMVVEDM